MGDGSGEGAHGRSLGQRVQRGFESKVLVPLAATIVSAATSYLIRKLPLILEEKVLPKLREQAGADGVRGTVAETATAVGERLTDGAPAEPSPDEGDDSSGARAGAASAENGAVRQAAVRQQSNEEREKERRLREERRRERKRALHQA